MPQSRTRRQQIRPRALLALGLGLAFLAAIPVVTAAGLDNEKQVRICHATSSKSNPYVENTPAIANNGDLEGGHLETSTRAGLIPPITGATSSRHTSRVDAAGEHVFPGSDNWGAGGQAIWENRCNPVTPPKPPPDPITPTFECVEPSGDGFIAHFGYDNPNSAGVTPLEERELLLARSERPEPADHVSARFAP